MTDALDERRPPPGSTPTWHCLAVLIVLAIASVLIPETLPVSTGLRGGIEFGAAVTAIAGCLAWIHVNRTALLAAEARPRRRHRGAVSL